MISKLNILEIIAKVKPRKAYINQGIKKVGNELVSFQCKCIFSFIVVKKLSNSVPVFLMLKHFLMIRN